MSKSIISEGKTTNEAIENGLKELKVSKNKVDIKVLESEEKRSFFSIAERPDNTYKGNQLAFIKNKLISVLKLPICYWWN